tara:strand:- start:1299 stop:1448 length:150 start_codon:yes stop_codon:yes gene_type:complete
MLEFLESIGAEITMNDGYIVIDNLTIADEWVVEIAKIARSSKEFLDCQR